MNFIDILFWGWYQILDKTIYSYKTEKGLIGPREHSFFITFLFHGINLWTILRVLIAKYRHAAIPLFLSLTIALLIFTLGYLIYFRGSRTNRVIFRPIKTGKAILFVILSVTYVIASVYFMFEAGSYVREQIAPK